MASSVRKEKYNLKYRDRKLSYTKLFTVSNINMFCYSFKLVFSEI